MTLNRGIEQAESFSSCSSYDHIEDILGPLSTADLETRDAPSSTTNCETGVDGPAGGGNGALLKTTVDGRATGSSTKSSNGLGRAREFLKSEVPYRDMLNMTMELVQDIYLNLRKDDRVMTNFGFGTVMEVPRRRQSCFSSRKPCQQHTSTCKDGDATASLSSLVIKLDFGGTLYLRNGREFVHKCLSTNSYDEAMDHLEQIRKLQLAAQCQDWGVDIPQNEDACVACMFKKPEFSSLYSSSSSSRSPASNDNNGRRGWAARMGFGGGSRSSSPANKTNDDASERPNSTSSQQESKNLLNTKTARPSKQRCDVCGNPVCPYHKLPSLGGHEYFCMCVDCQHDLTQAEHQWKSTRSKNKLTGSAPYHSPEWWTQWHGNLQRLVLYYTRMAIQLTTVVPGLHDLAAQLTSKQKIDSRISIGNSALGFVGAALGVAGAAAMVTPAGPAILLAAVATSATSGTLQFSHQSYNKYLSKKEAHQLADKVLGWHGLCLGILNGLEQLRLDLLSEVVVGRMKPSANDSTTGDGDTKALNHQNSNASNNRTGTTTDSSKASLEIWNTLAVGSFTTTRQAMTMTGATAAMGASYSQAVTTTLQGIPVVGGIFSVGCMAMDAANIQAALKQLQTPSQKGEALLQIQNVFCKPNWQSAKLPNNIEEHVGLIQHAMDQLHHSLLLDGDYVVLQ